MVDVSELLSLKLVGIDLIVSRIPSIAIQMLMPFVNICIICFGLYLLCSITIVLFLSYVQSSFHSNKDLGVEGK